jgi:hypothetical protein
LGAPLRPVQRRALRIGIEQNNLLAAHCQLASDVRGERGLADAAFLIEQGDDHDPALLAGKPGFLRRAKRCTPCRSVLIHRNGALLLKVKEFKLGKLEGLETSAVIGFSAVSHA